MAHPAKTVQGRRKLAELPPEAATPDEAGHLQSDTVVSCVGGLGGVFVLYDRVSRKYWLEILPAIDQVSVLRAIARLLSSKRIHAIRQLRKVERYINSMHRKVLGGVTADRKDRELRGVA